MQQYNHVEHTKKLIELLESVSDATAFYSIVSALTLYQYQRLVCYLDYNHQGEKLYNYFNPKIDANNIKGYVSMEDIVERYIFLKKQAFEKLSEIEKGFIVKELFLYSVNTKYTRINKKRI